MNNCTYFYKHCKYDALSYGDPSFGLKKERNELNLQAKYLYLYIVNRVNYIYKDIEYSYIIWEFLVI